MSGRKYCGATKHLLLSNVSITVSLTFSFMPLFWKPKTKIMLFLVIVPLLIRFI